MMKPILFNTEMVRAVLDGKKTQTRRVIKPEPKTVYAQDNFNFLNIPGKGPVWDHKIYQVGDILWVRETWAETWTPDSNDVGFVYKADGKPPKFPYWGNAKQSKDEVWMPSIHMRKEAARLFLKVTNVRVNRLQDITEDEAMAEGVNPSCCPPYEHLSHLLAFKDIWESIYNNWLDNPWVWVIEFEVVEGEIS